MSVVVPVVVKVLPKVVPEAVRVLEMLAAPEMLLLVRLFTPLLVSVLLTDELIRVMAPLLDCSAPLSVVLLREIAPLSERTEPLTVLLPVAITVP